VEHADHPHQRVRDPPTQRMRVTVGVENQSVRHRERSVRGAEVRGQDERSRQVGPRGVVLTGRADRSVTGTRVEQPAEDRSRVEAWQASQSTEPVSLTSAAEWQSDRSA